MTDFITKEYLQSFFNNVIDEFSNKILKINSINLEFLTEDEFNNFLCKNTNISTYINKKVINSVKEYPGFLLIHKSNNNKASVSIQFEKAKKQLEKLSKEEVDIYLKHDFAHEICHIYEDEVIEKYPVMWDKIKHHINDNKNIYSEVLAVLIGDILVPSNEYKKISKKIWNDFEINF